MIMVHVNAKQTPDSNIESPVFPVFTGGPHDRQALQLKSKHNIHHSLEKRALVIKNTFAHQQRQ